MFDKSHLKMQQFVHAYPGHFRRLKLMTGSKYNKQKEKLVHTTTMTNTCEHVHIPSDSFCRVI